MGPAVASLRATAVSSLHGQHVEVLNTCQLRYTLPQLYPPCMLLAAGADVRFGDVTDLDSLRSVAFKDSVDVVVSCLASRTGGKKDSWDIDYQAR